MNIAKRTHVQGEPTQTYHHIARDGRHYETLNPLRPSIAKYFVVSNCPEIQACFEIYYNFYQEKK